MGTVMKLIRIVTRSNANGEITPVRIKVQDDTETGQTVVVDKVVKREETRITGSNHLLFLCRSLMNDKMRQFELSLDLLSCRWYLHSRG